MIAGPPSTFHIILGIISMLIALTNAGMLVWLLFIYYDVYKKIKAPFTKGLMVFVGFLLLQKIMMIVGVSVVAMERNPRLGIPFAVMNVLELAALIIFVKLSRE
jgi:hypothetical protein